MATVVREGRRIWVKTQYGEQIVGALKNLGARWDGERKAWWLGSRKAEQVAALIAQPADAVEDVERARLARDQENILGTATYQGHSYYLVGRGTNERGQWTRLMFRDGSKTFFKAGDEVTVTKMYARTQTLAGLQEYAERRKREQETGVCECWCHTDARCHCPQSVCPIHFDGCDSCGCENDG